MDVFERDGIICTILKSIVNEGKRSKVKKITKGVTNEDVTHEQLEVYRQRLLLFPTKREIVMKQILDSFGIKYEFQQILFPYICDFVIKDNKGTDKCVIEIDGSSHKNNEVHDEKRDWYIKTNYGLKTYRFKNGEVKNTAEFIGGLLKIIGLMPN